MCQNFPSVSATFRSGDVTRQPGGESAYTCWPAAKFEYTVDGTNYTSTRIWSLGSSWLVGLTDRQANQILEVLYHDPDLRAYYDPKNPSFAFIYNGQKAQVWTELILGVIVVSMGTYFGRHNLTPP